MSRYGIRTSAQTRELVRGLDLTYIALEQARASAVSKRRVKNMIEKIVEQAYDEWGVTIRSKILGN